MQKVAQDCVGLGEKILENPRTAPSLPGLALPVFLMENLEDNERHTYGFFPFRMSANLFKTRFCSLKCVSWKILYNTIYTSVRQWLISMCVVA